MFSTAHILNNYFLVFHRAPNIELGSLPIETILFGCLFFFNQKYALEFRHGRSERIVFGGIREDRNINLSHTVLNVVETPFFTLFHISHIELEIFGIFQYSFCKAIHNSLASFRDFSAVFVSLMYR